VSLVRIILQVVGVVSLTGFDMDDVTAILMIVELIYFTLLLTIIFPTAPLHDARDDDSHFKRIDV